MKTSAIPNLNHQTLSMTGAKKKNEIPLGAKIAIGVGVTGIFATLAAWKKGK